MWPCGCWRGGVAVPKPKSRLLSGGWGFEDEARSGEVVPYRSKSVRRGTRWGCDRTSRRAGGAEVSPFIKLLCGLRLTNPRPADELDDTLETVETVETDEIVEIVVSVVWVSDPVNEPPSGGTIIILALAVGVGLVWSICTSGAGARGRSVSSRWVFESTAAISKCWHCLHSVD